VANLKVWNKRGGRVGVGSGASAENFGKFYPKIMHFGAKFSLVLR